MLTRVLFIMAKNWKQPKVHQLPSGRHAAVRPSLQRGWSVENEATSDITATWLCLSTTWDRETRCLSIHAIGFHLYKAQGKKYLTGNKEMQSCGSPGGRMGVH